MRRRKLFAKKAASVILAVGMIMSSAPVNAFAASSEETAGDPAAVFYEEESEGATQTETDQELVGVPEEQGSTEAQEPTVAPVEDEDAGSNLIAYDDESGMITVEPDSASSATAEESWSVEPSSDSAIVADGESTEPIVVDNQLSADGSITVDETQQAPAATNEVAAPDWRTIMSENQNMVPDIDKVDFTSKRLLVGTTNPSLVIDYENVLSSYDGLYLIQYESTEDARLAYGYYTGRADFVDLDITVKTADGEENPVGDTAMTVEENPISELKEAIEDADKIKAKNLIALIDTGASENSRVKERVSMLGDDVSDMNGHGDKMVEYILSQNENADILSIKALNEDGKGNVSSVCSAIKYAMKQKAKIINLSIYAFSTAENESVKAVIHEAVTSGIVVVGSAGNDSRNVRYYVPGNIDEAIIVAACDQNGQLISSTNYGDTVDFYVNSESTSEAAAKMSGFISAHLSDGKVDLTSLNQNGLIFSKDYAPIVAPEEPAAEPTVEPTPTEEPAEEEKPAGLMWNGKLISEMTPEEIYNAYVEICKAHPEMTETILNPTPEEAAIIQAFLEIPYDFDGNQFQTAASKYDVETNGIALEYDYPGHARNGTMVKYLSVDNKCAYCVKPMAVFYVKGVTYNADRVAGETIRRTAYSYALHHGLQYFKKGKRASSAYTTGSLYGDYFVTQLAIWHIQNETKDGEDTIDVEKATLITPDPKNNALAGKMNVSVSTIKKKALKLAGAALAYAETAKSAGEMKYSELEPTLEFSPASVYCDELTSDGKYYQSELVTMKTSGKAVNYDVAKDVKLDNDKFEIVPQSEKTFYVRIPVAKVTGTQRVQGNLTSTATWKRFVAATHEPISWPGKGEQGNKKPQLVLWGSTEEETGSKTAKMTAYANPIQKGRVRIVKKSTNPEITNSCPLYSLNGAEFSVYKDAAGQQLVCKLTTANEAKGEAKTQVSPELEPGTYYVEETKPPKGFKRLTGTKLLKVTAKNDEQHPAELVFEDEPSVDPIGINLRKVRLEPDGYEYKKAALPLSDAKFKVSYYNGNYNSLDDLPDEPTAVWVIRTKGEKNVDNTVSYKTSLDEEHFVSGSPLYKVNGEVGLPMGTYTIEETEAPKGYSMEYAVVSVNQKEMSFPLILHETQQVIEAGNGLIEADVLEPQIEIETTATCSETGTHYGVAGTMTIHDEIRYSNLEPDTDYVFVGKIIDQDTKKEIATAKSKTFVPGTVNPDEEEEEDPDAEDDLSPVVTGLLSGTESVDFEGLDMEALAGKHLVIEEYLYSADDTKFENPLADHKDLTGEELESQSIYVPSIGTDAKDAETKNHVMNAAKNARLIDTVTYKNLEAGETYHIVGNVMAIGKDGTATQFVDADGKEVTAETNITIEKTSGSVEIPFEFNAEGLEDTTLVVFEKCFLVKGDEEVEVGRHEDPNDKNQTVYIPKLDTEAKDEETGTDHTEAKKVDHIKDEVTFTNAYTDIPYEITGSVHDQKTGEEIEAEIIAAEYNGTALEPQTAEDGTQFVRFTPSEPNGSVTVTFEFDAKAIEGTTAVVFEKMLYDGKEVAAHTDLHAEKQTFYDPKVRTTAVSDDTEINVTNNNEEVFLTDTVTYEGLKPETTYHLYGTVHLQETDEEGNVVDGGEVASEIVDENQEPISYVEFTTEAAEEGNENAGVSGTIDVHLKLDATEYEGKTLVCFEKLMLVDEDGTEKRVGSHEEIKDEPQSVYVPAVRTIAVDGDTDAHVMYAKEGAQIIDTVEYSNMKPGTTCRFAGTVMIIDEEGNAVPFVDADGKTVTAEDTVDIENPNGKMELTFNFNATGFENRTLVVFEKCYLVKDNDEKEEVLIAEHEDPNDENQSIHIPEISTEEVDEKTGTDHTPADGFMRIIDAVHFENVVPGLEYTMAGTIRDQETGEIITSTLVKGEYNGQDLEPYSKGEGALSEPAYVYFTPEETDGVVYLTFEFDAKAVEGTTAVVFEDMSHNEKTVAVHADLKAQPQTGYVPMVRTSVVSDDTNTNITNNNKEVYLTDTVAYHSLKPATTYRLYGTVHIREEDEEGAITDGGVVEAEMVDENKESIPYVEFTTRDAEEGNENAGVSGTVDVHFFLDAEAYENCTLVCFEKLMLAQGEEEIEVGRHEEITDEMQSVYIPKIGTEAADGTTKLHIGLVEDKVTITDIVRYENLIPGQRYKFSGTLMEKIVDETAEPAEDGTVSYKAKEFLVNGNPVKADYVLNSAPDADGEVELKFTFDGSALENKKLVAFELMTVANAEGTEVPVADHEEPNDEDQSVRYPEIRTSAVDENTGAHTADSASQNVLVDEVSYKGLIPNTEYTVKGTVHLSDSGKEVPSVMIDEEGNEINGVTFHPETEDGSITIRMRYDASSLSGKTVVAYEKIYTPGLEGEAELIGKHEDPHDEEQSVHIPGVGTVATDANNGAKETQAKQTTVIKDVVTYTNLVKGYSYKVVGTLKLKSNGETLKKADGTDVTVESEVFKAAKADGSLTLNFTVDTSSLAGGTVVAFEKLYLVKKGDNDTETTEPKEVARHEKIDDEDQSVNVVNVKTTATGKATGTHEAGYGKKTVIVDRVYYYGLTVGKEYVVEGTLHNKSTGAPLKGTGAKKKQKFTAQTSDGYIDLTFTIDSRKLIGKQVVAFENLYRNNILIATHSDLKDENQAVRIVKISTKLTDKKTGKQTATEGTKTVLVDKVSYKGLTPDKKYKLVCVLMDKETGKSTGVTEKKTFTAKAVNGSVNVELTIDTTKYAGKQLVAFESLYTESGKLITKHADIKDKAQTINMPGENKKTGSGSGSGSSSDKSLSNVKTGDTMKPFLFAFLMVAAIGAIAAVVLTKKKRARK